MEPITIGALSFSIIDIIIFAICMVSAVFCCINGIVKELSKWFGLVVGLLAGFMFTSSLSPTVSGWLPEGFPAWLSTVITFAGLTLCGFILVLLFGRMLAKILETFKLGPLDHILGFVWGLALSLLLVGAIVSLLMRQSLFDVSGLVSNSAIITRIILPLMPHAAPLLEEAVNLGMDGISGVVNAV